MSLKSLIFLSFHFICSYMIARNNCLDVDTLILVKWFLFALSIPLNFFIISGLIHWQHEVFFSANAVQNVYIA